MESKVVLVGKIEFEPENITKKHNTQSPWKRIAMVKLDGDKVRIDFENGTPYNSSHCKNISLIFVYFSLE